MTVATETSRATFTCNGVTTAFSFPYYFLANADLVVIKKLISTGAETPLVLDTDYTVAGAGVQAGGTITTIGAGSPISSLYKLTVYRDPAKTQELDLVENDPLPAEPTEKAFDRLTMIAQRLSNWLSRTAKLSDGIADGVFDPTFPVDIVGAIDKVPITNAAGTGWATAAEWPSATDIEDAQPNAAAAAVSAAAALVSETAAAASELAASNSVNSVFWRDVVFITFSDSPFTVSNSHRGKYISVDASGGAVAVTLPAIAGLDLTSAFVFGIKKTDSSANAVTMTRASTDTIEGATTKILATQGVGCIFIPDTDPAPDVWTVADFGTAVDGSITAVKIATGAVTSIKKVETIASKTFSDTGYTLTSSDGLILCDASGGATTLNLPAASGVSGRVYQFKKTDTSANAITVDGNSSETIDGKLTQLLNFPFQSIVIVSDGSNWRILDQQFGSPLVTTTIWKNTDGTALTKGTVTVDSLVWSRHGKYMKIYIEYSADNSSVSSGATTNLCLKIPGSLTIDTNFVDAFTGTYGTAGTELAKGVVGRGVGLLNNDGRPYEAWPQVYNTTLFRILAERTGDTSSAYQTTTQWNSGSNPFTWNLELDVPIAEWT